MAFVNADLALISSVNGFGLYVYKSDTDTRATVTASGYFNNTDDDLNLAADDRIMVIGDQGFYTLRVDTVSAGVVTTEMAGEPMWLSGVIDDVSTAASIWMVAPFDGVIGRFKTVLGGAITVADAAVGIELAGVDVTGCQLTIAFTGSAAGDVDQGEATAANVVSEGDAIEVDTDGGSTTAQKLYCFVEIMPL